MLSYFASLIKKHNAVVDAMRAKDPSIKCVAVGAVGLGVALALKAKGSDRRVYVLIGDGECNEGSVWEAFMAAGHHEALRGFRTAILYFVIPLTLATLIVLAGRDVRRKIRN